MQVPTWCRVIGALTASRFGGRGGDAVAPTCCSETVDWRRHQSDLSSPSASCRPTCSSLPTRTCKCQQTDMLCVYSGRSLANALESHHVCDYVLPAETCGIANLLNACVNQALGTLDIGAVLRAIDANTQRGRINGDSMGQQTRQWMLVTCSVIWPVFLSTLILHPPPIDLVSCHHQA